MQFAGTVYALEVVTGRSQGPAGGEGMNGGVDENGSADGTQKFPCPPVEHGHERDIGVTTYGGPLEQLVLVIVVKRKQSAVLLHDPQLVSDVFAYGVGSVETETTVSRILLHR